MLRTWPSEFSASRRRAIAVAILFVASTPSAVGVCGVHPFHRRRRRLEPEPTSRRSSRPGRRFWLMDPPCRQGEHFGLRFHKNVKTGSVAMEISQSPSILEKKSFFESLSVILLDFVSDKIHLLYEKTKSKSQNGKVDPKSKAEKLMESES